MAPDDTWRNQQSYQNTSWVGHECLKQTLWQSIQLSLSCFTNVKVLVPQTDTGISRNMLLAWCKKDLILWLLRAKRLHFEARKMNWKKTIPRLLLTKSTTIATKETLKIIIMSIAHWRKKQFKHAPWIDGTQSQQIKKNGCAVLQWLALCLGSVITYLKCACWLIDVGSVPRRLSAVLDWWRFNENNKLSSLSLTHRPSSCLFVF